MKVEPQSPDTVTLSCEMLQSTGGKFLWKKNSLDVQHELKTLTVTLLKEGGEYMCAARRGDYFTPYSDPVMITVVGMSHFLFRFRQMT